MLHNKYFEIMNEFLKGYSREVYGSELVGKVGMSQKAISLTLKELEDARVLHSRTKGNLKYYSFNFLNPLIKGYISFVERWRTLKFFEKHKRLLDFLEGIDAEAVVVFGSYANGTYNSGSDLDIYVVGRTDLNKIREGAENYSIDIQIFSTSILDFRKSLRSGDVMVKEVLGNHVIVRGSDFYVKEVIECLKLTGV